MIKVLNVNKYIRENKSIGPVESAQMFIGKSYSFHPKGVMSEELFGIYGSPERRTQSSWIDLNCNVIHPMLYDILYKRIEKKIEPLLSGEAIFSLTPEGYLEENPQGDLSGMSDIVSNIDKWKFRLSEDESDRNKIIQMMYKSIKSGTFFLDKLILIPPEFRPVQILEEKNEVINDPLNELYMKIIMLSNQVKNVSGSLFDILSYRMQMHLRELNELIRQKVSKKGGMIRRLMLGKRTDFSARSVISPNPKLTLGVTGVPLRIVCQVFEPHMLYGLSNAPEASEIPPEFYEEVKKFLGKEREIDVEF